MTSEPMVAPNYQQYEPSLDVKLNRRQSSIEDIRMHTLASLADIPKPTTLIHGMLDLGALAVLYGGPGVGKTFAALDLGLHVALGRPWLGRETQYGSVIYVAAEGYKSLGRRAKAWLEYYGIPEAPDNFKIVIDPVNLMGGSTTQRIFIEQAISAAEEMRIHTYMALDLNNEAYEETDEITPPPVKLIVFDTLARCVVGAEENDARDMGQMIQWVDTIREQSIVASTPTVILVHHSSKGSVIERGSSVIRGAADTMLYMKNDGSGPVLTCTKQKDDEPFTQQLFLIKRLPTGEAVIVPRVVKPQMTPGLEAPFEELIETLGARQQKTLAMMAGLGGIDDGVQLKAVSAPYTAPDAVDKVTEPAIYQSLMKLREKLLVHYASEEAGPKLWTITKKGWAFIDFMKKQKEQEIQKALDEAPDQPSTAV